MFMCESLIISFEDNICYVGMLRHLPAKKIKKFPRLMSSRINVVRH
jgi:hypothetical protein